MKYFWFLSPTQLLIQGQWWSILRMHRLQIRQWCARGGRYISHLLMGEIHSELLPFALLLSFGFIIGKFIPNSPERFVIKLISQNR